MPTLNYDKKQQYIICEIFSGCDKQNQTKIKYKSEYNKDSEVYMEYRINEKNTSIVMNRIT